LPNSSSTSAVPYRSTDKIVPGAAWLGETPAAWMTPATSSSAAAVWTSVCTDSRRHVDGCGAHLESCIAQYLGGCVGVLRAQVSQHDMLARTHPPRDRLANRPLSNDDNVVTHNDALCIICLTSKPTTGLLQRTRPYQGSPARQHRPTGNLSSRSSAAPCSTRYPDTGRLADKVHIHGRNRSRGPGLGLAQLGACRNRDPRCLRLGLGRRLGILQRIVTAGSTPTAGRPTPAKTRHERCGSPGPAVWYSSLPRMVQS